MEISGSKNRKRSGRQFAALASGATLALGTLGMMTLGAGGTAYAQSTASKTLTASVEIGTVAAPTAAAPIYQSNSEVGQSNTLSFDLVATTTVAVTGTDTFTFKEQSSAPWSFSGTSTGEVYDSTTGQLLTLTYVSADKDFSVTLPAGSTSVTISSGNTLDFVLRGVTNSTDVATSTITPEVDTTSLGVTASGSTTTPAGLSLSDPTDPGQVTVAEYTFLKGKKLSSGDTIGFTLSADISGSLGAIPSADISTGSATLTVDGTSYTSGVTISSAASGSVSIKADSGTTVPSGTWVLDVPIKSVGPGVVEATYSGTASSGTFNEGTYGYQTGATTWGVDEDVTSVTASNPYANATSTVTVDFVNFASGTTSLTVAGLGLSSDSRPVVGSLMDVTTGVSEGFLSFGAGQNSSGAGSVTLASGDQYSLTLQSVPLPSASVTVSLSTGFENPGTAMLTLGSTATSGMVVSASTSGVGVPANWTFSNIELATGLASGSTLSLSATSGSSAAFLPLEASDYNITDLTTSADSQVPAVSVNGDTATLTLTKAIPSGATIDITVDGVFNPLASGDYTATLTATADSLESGLLTAPSAASPQAMANGSIANVNGSLYVWAGMYAFHLPNVPDAAVIEKAEGNPTQQTVGVPSSDVFASGDTLTEGTLVQGVQSGAILAPIYVVGASGDLYHIASPATFMSDGYSAKDVVEIPQADLAMMTMAPSSATVPMAASVEANGSFWQASGSTGIYEWVGGVAIPVANPGDLVSIAKYMGESLMAHWPQVALSSLSASQMEPTAPAMGTVVQVLDGSAAGSYWVSSGTSLIQVSASDLTSLGYPMADVLEISGPGTIPLVPLAN
ncbi:MAG: hypothetical protein MP439_09240 [Ferrimicrobium sp.]|jgi:hypothetical protein|nr:hypothetical protein [Ferrimicrobium sp.]